MRVNEWKRELPTKSGYYWAVVKEQGLNVIVPLVVGEIEDGILGCCMGTAEPNLLNDMKESVLFWNGPVDAPELPQEIKEEVGELQEI